MDSEYKAKRQQKNLHKPQNVGEGLKEGAKDLGKGLFQGLSGIIVEPVKGFKQEGAVGLLKGIGKGIIG
jgi:vacuolar protein sorting-associated protein 13A/C